MRHKGFTLIEMLVVVLVVGILVAVALPEYRKAVASSHFSEAVSTLSTIAKSHQLCAMSKDDCTWDDLDVSIGSQEGNGPRETEHFIYMLNNPGGSKDVWASALYKKEDICVCHLRTGETVLVNEYEEGGCVDKEPSFDYADLLNIMEVDYSVCGCC